MKCGIASDPPCARCKKPGRVPLLRRRSGPHSNGNLSSRYKYARPQELASWFGHPILRNVNTTASTGATPTVLPAVGVPFGPIEPTVAVQSLYTEQRQPPSPENSSRHSQSQGTASNLPSIDSMSAVEVVSEPSPSTAETPRSPFSPKKRKWSEAQSGDGGTPPIFHRIASLRFSEEVAIPKQDIRDMIEM
jgi:hypothetical protein